MQNQFDKLNKLLEIFFNPHSRDIDKVKASTNLINLSQSEHFIDLAMTLLSEDKVAPDRKLLMTIMIKDKFKYDFELLNAQLIPHYYEILVQTAQSLGIGTKPIFSNISQSLALIYLNYLANYELSITDYLQPMTNNKENMQLFNYYFKVMQQCAEVVGNSRVVVKEESRQTAKERLINQQSSVIQLLNNSLETIWHHPQVSGLVSKKRIINCFQSWIQLHYDPNLYNTLHQTPLLQQTVAALRDPQLTADAAECLKAIINSYPSAEHNPQLYFYIGTQMHQLLPFIQQNRANESMVQELMELLVYFSERSAKQLVLHYDQGVNIFLQALIGFMGTRMQEVVVSLFNFWEQILYQFLKAKADKNNPIDMSPSLSIKLLQVITALIRYPPQYIQELNSTAESKLGNRHEQAESIFYNRLAAQTCYQFLADLMGLDFYCHHIFQKIQSLDVQNDCFYSELESWCFALVFVLKKYTQISNNILLGVELYMRLREANNPIPVILRSTFLRIFKSVFTIYIEDYNLVQQLYFCTIDCFPQPLLTDLASRTFYKACQINPRYIYNYLPQVSKLIQSYPLEEFIYRGYVCLAVYDEQLAFLMIEACLNFLLEFATSHLQSDYTFKQCIHTMTTTLKETSLHHFVDKKQLFKGFLSRSWPFILECLSTPLRQTEDNDTKIQRTVKLIKAIMRIMKKDFVIYLQSLYNTTLSAFKRYPICSYMYLLEITVAIYAEDATEKRLLQQFYESFTSVAFEYLSSPQSINSCGYLVDDFLGMNSRLLIYNTQIIVSSNHFPNLLTFITQDCKQTTSAKVIKANHSFLHTLFMIYWTKPFIKALKDCGKNDDTSSALNIQPIIKSPHIYHDLKEYLQDQLSVILQRMFKQLENVPPDETKNQIIDAIISSIKAFPEKNPSAWKQLMAKTPSSILLQAEKEQILNLIQNIRQYAEDYEKLRQLIKKMMKFMELIYKRMAIAQKRKKFHLKE